MIFRAHLVAGIVALGLAAGSATAQQNTIAKLQDVQGNVLVSQGDAMVAAADNQRLSAGTRVVTTAGAKVTINYDAGCDIKLNENQRFTVSVGPCAALLAQVENLGPAAGAIGGGEGAVAAASATGGNVGTIVGVGVLAAAAAAALVNSRKSNPVSPN